MSLIIQLPPELERRLRFQTPNLDAQARETILIDLYRKDQLSQVELGEALGLDRIQIDGLLKKHNVTEDLPTQDEYDAALAHLNAAGNP